MFPFKDIFVIQIIGLLSERGFSGDCNLRTARDARLRFAQGQLVDASYGSETGGSALRALLWVQVGWIELVPGDDGAGDGNPMESLDDLIAESSPPMPESGPLLQGLVLEWGRLPPRTGSALAPAGQAILENIRHRGGRLALTQGGLAPETFWRGLFHLLGSGQLFVNYGASLNPFLFKLQNDVMANLQRFLGTRVTQLYQERLTSGLNASWPDWPALRAYDPLYGTAPYRTWMHLIGEATGKVTSVALGGACYKQALAKLSPSEASLVQQLLN